MPKKGEKINRLYLEFGLATLIATLLIVSLLSQQFTNFIPRDVVITLLVTFIAVKIYNIIRKRGTIFEDYLALGIIIVFGFLHFILGETKLNTVVLVIMTIAILYSVGLVPSLKHLSRSQSITAFIVGYIFFIVAIVFLFAGTYAVTNTQFLQAGSPTQISFENALYFSTMTFTTVGYGDISPAGINRLIASIEAISGIVLNIAFLGYILSAKRFKE